LLRTFVRSALLVEAQLVNPSGASPLELSVTLEGEGLVGPPTILLPPGATRTYTFLYAPFLPTVSGGGGGGGGENEEEGGSNGGDPGFLVFTPMVQVEDSSGGGGGEIIFYLSLTALPAPPTLLPTITTPLGSTALSYATLENPTARPAVIKGSLHCFPEEEDGTPAGVWVMPMKECLVMDNYNFGDETVETPAASVAAAVRGVPWRGNILPPFSSLRVPIRYSPSSLLRAQTAELTFESPTLGRWVFHCTGRGTAPDSQLSSPHFISAPVALNSEGELCGTISQLPFKNPFNAPLKLTLTLSMTLDASAAAGPHP